MVQFETPGLLGLLAEHSFSLASTAEKSPGDCAHAEAAARVATAAITILFTVVLANRWYGAVYAASIYREIVYSDRRIYFFSARSTRRIEFGTHCLPIARRRTRIHRLGGSLERDSNGSFAHVLRVDAGAPVVLSVLKRRSVPVTKPRPQRFVE